MIDRDSDFSMVPCGSQLLVTGERATLPCGCHAHVGMLFPSREPGVSVCRCSDEHLQLTQVFLGRYRLSLEHPTDRLAVDVADELLESAAQEVGAS